MSTKSTEVKWQMAGQFNSTIGLRVLVLLQVIHGKVEEIELPEKADILISEPMGESLAIIIRGQ